MGFASKKENRIAPRYRFSDKEREVVRFINGRQARVMSTVIIDISETGIGFLTSVKLAPRIGEIIKMDFSPLGSMRMACQGRVIHMETPPATSGWNRFPNTVKVGVQFHNMPKEFTRILHEVLEAAFKVQGRDIGEIRKTPRRTFNLSLSNPHTSWLRENIWSVLVTIALMVGVGYGIYYFVENEPDLASTRQPQHAWASGFFERTIKK